MDLRNLVDVSPFLLFEATADSDQLEVSSFDDHHHPSTVMDYAIDQYHHDDNDDAESCSYDVSDHSSCVSDDSNFNACGGDSVGASRALVDDDDDDGYEECEVEEGEIYWPGNDCAEEKPSACVDSVSSKEVMVMSEMERNRLFWETCLAS